MKMFFPQTITAFAEEYTNNSIVTLKEYLKNVTTVAKACDARRDEFVPCILY